MGDVAARRAAVTALLSVYFGQVPAAPEVTVTHHACTAPDGAEVPLSLYLPPGGAGGGLVVYCHGGGMIMGSVPLYDPWLRMLASRSGVALLAPDYRVAPEHPHPAPVEDCFAALRWAADNAAVHGCDPARLGVAGDSAGGGLAAALALLARDRRGPALRRQILVYPMLDDRNRTASPSTPGLVLWSHDDNATGWGALLGDGAGGPDVEPYAAPARATDLAGLPPAYVMVGDGDIFLAEDLEYARALVAAGVPVELHVHLGGPHAFDFFAPDSGIGARALADEVRALQSV
ncbi:alpha/beta hydrolase [Paraconexibacter antarcticus]|uniref:Alpha/beta hydrolase n=1 Tax=Paraconexibacter antarcticus TaxID=2949664 RepID=A0ABY5DNL6_9ACTN|nr:alpha/beta hydrolase [Paraconexibacter antarcticus]UTI63621.1 alpha/beta hydrolase [Paraconexibacter antarcticus]